MKKIHSHILRMEREWQKSNPWIRGQKGNEKIHFHISGTGIGGFHSWEWTGKGIPAHPWRMMSTTTFPTSKLLSYTAISTWCDVCWQNTLSPHLVQPAQPENLFDGWNNLLWAFKQFLEGLRRSADDSDTHASASDSPLQWFDDFCSLVSIFGYHARRHF